VAFRCVEAHIVRVHAHHLVETSIKPYQIYVVVLMGINIFLRANELLSSKMEHFDKNLSVVNAEEECAISIWVKGKSDKIKKGLYFFKDAICPECCPLWHILVYISVTGTTSRYFFPCMKRGTLSTPLGSTRWKYSAWRNKRWYGIANHCGTKNVLMLKNCE
jgi:hypothetical protein